MKRPGFIIAVLFLSNLLLALPAKADFREIVRSIEQKGRVQHTWIPFFWLGRMVVHMHAIEGVSDIQLATFEKSEISSIDLDSIVRANSKERWQPIIVARSNRDHEQTYIYSREERGQMQLLIVARDGEDTTVMQLRVAPERFLATIRNPGESSERFAF
ncbi:MAG: hypothetical protein ABI718_12060 [Acidobacteriota bacterium]